MEGMLNDLAVGADHQKEFLEYLKVGPKAD
jgi:hypothetical protein